MVRLRSITQQSDKIVFEHYCKPQKSKKSGNVSYGGQYYV